MPSSGVTFNCNRALVQSSDTLPLEINYILKERTYDSLSKQSELNSLLKYFRDIFPHYSYYLQT